MAVENPARQIDERADLRGRERHIAEFMTGIDDLDADGARIHVALAGPPGDAGVPGSHIFGYEAVDYALFVDDIMRADLRCWVAKALDGGFGGGHGGVVEDQYLH